VFIRVIPSILFARPCIPPRLLSTNVAMSGHKCITRVSTADDASLMSALHGFSWESVISGPTQ